MKVDREFMRHTSFALALPFLFAACVGDDLVVPNTSSSSSSSSGNTDDGGSSSSGGSSSGTPDAGSTAALVELYTDPVVLVHGTTTSVRVRVQRTGQGFPISVELGGGPPGLTFGASKVVLTNETDVEIGVTTSTATPTGSATLQVTATAPQLEQPVVLNVLTSVRGAPGELDETWTSPPAVFARFVAANDFGQVMVVGDGISILSESGEPQGVAIPPVGDCVWSNSFSVEAKGNHWDVAGTCGEGRPLVAHIPFATPQDVTFTPTPPGPTAIRSPLGPINFLIPVPSGYVWGYNYGYEYNYVASVSKINIDAQTSAGWPTPLSDEGPEQILLLTDLAASGSGIHAIASHYNTYDDEYPYRSLVTFSQNGQRLGSTVSDMYLGSHLWLDSDGSALAVRTAQRACVVRVTPTGQAAYLPLGCDNSAFRLSESDGHAFRLRDGRIVVVRVGFESRFWTLSANGEAQSPLDGTVIDLPYSRNGQIFHLLESSDQRVFVFGSSRGESADTGYALRFWL